MSTAPPATPASPERGASSATADSTPTAPRRRNRLRLAVLLLGLVVALGALAATTPQRRAMWDSVWRQRLEVEWGRQQQEDALRNRALRAELRGNLRRLIANPEDVEALLGAASGWGQLREYDDALFLLEEVLRLSPREVRAHRARGEVFLAAGKYDRCIEALDAGLRVAPDDMELNLLRVNVDTILGRLSAAQRRLRPLLEKFPKESRVHLMAGLVARQTADAKGAEEHLRQALALHPDADRVHALMSGLAWELGRREEAMSHIQRAIQLNPGVADYLLHLGEMQRAAAATHPAAWLEAERTYRRALELNPGSTQAQFGLAVCTLQRNPAEGQTMLEQLLKVAPHNSGALLELGRLYSRQGRREEGAALLARYQEGVKENDQLKGLNLRMAMQPDNAEAQRDYGELHLRIGLPQKAAFFLREAVRLNPRDEQARASLHTALIASGREQELDAILANP